MVYQDIWEKMFWCTMYILQILYEEKNKGKKFCYKKIYNSANLSGQGERFCKKKLKKDSGTGREGKIKS